ncbi:MAG TPA: DUF4190 domain-containing protein [Blastocatellia bacterium]|nr:DUF4190 domain-containing protein [Blastocatellia bacterium]
MVTLHKVCPECGLGLEPGLANCPHCGQQIGTVFSEEAVLQFDQRPKTQRRAKNEVSEYARLETAQERANNSVVLGLAGFIPLIGFILALFAVVFGFASTKVLKERHIEEGRGSATAGVVIGSLAIIAQVCYLLWFLNIGSGGGD